ncbi:hypothetical protein ACFS5N_17705 [Mucilaginibacter ximonensis]|uniref:Uncharacterized protein n=1 Tax=Mucilaginibacter ximonensis TaxID=538021 RepID=A0ABW5YHS1_9SPHI
MKLFSSEDFYFTTKLTPAEVKVRLDEMVGVHNYQFSGYTVDNIFKLQPIDTKKSLSPEIDGSIEPWQSGSRITASIKLPQRTTLFLKISIGVMIAATIATLINMVFTIRDHHNFFPWFVIFLCYIPLINNSHTESKKLKEGLVRALEGEEQLV